jgi:hypothetical protein
VERHSVALQHTPNPVGTSDDLLDAVGRELGRRRLDSRERSGPRKATDVALDAVSCAAPGACIAVGSSYTATFELTPAESWNGSAWTIGARLIVDDRGTPDPV